MRWQDVSTMDTGAQMVLGVQVFIAAVCGAIIGIEREFAGKRAGLRTHMLVAIASAAAVGLGRLILAGSQGDATRVFHGLLTGIGFIGAGAIITGKRSPGGLTTAATIFLVSVLGAACGFGAPLLALSGALLAVMLLRGIYWVERPMRFAINKVRRGPRVVEDDLG